MILNGLGPHQVRRAVRGVENRGGRCSRDAGYNVVRPEVGELVTSLDMAGCSLTVMWLDDELETAVDAPRPTPPRTAKASHRVRHTHCATAAMRPPQTLEATTDGLIAADEAARTCGAQLPTRWWRSPPGCPTPRPNSAASTPSPATVTTVAAWSRVPRRRRAAATSAARRGGGTEAVLVAAGEAWAAKAGGTSGVLWGAALAAAGRRLGDHGRLRLASTWPRRCAPDMTR